MTDSILLNIGVVATNIIHSMHLFLPDPLGLFPTTSSSPSSLQVRPVWCVGTRLCVGMENELCLSYATHCFVVFFLPLVAIAMKCPTPHWTPRPHQARDTNGHNCPSSLPRAHTTVDVHGENKWPAPDKPCLFMCTSANLCWCCRVTAYCLLCMVCGVTGIAQYA